MLKNLKIISLIIFVMLINIVFSQTKIEGNFGFQPENTVLKIIDTTKFNIIYNYAFKNDSILNTYTKNSKVIVQIGLNFVKSTDYDKLLLDSLNLSFLSKKKILAKDVNETFKIYSKIAWKIDFINDINNSSFIYQKTIPSNLYEYNTSKVELEWRIYDEFKEMNELKTQKASTQYRGRTWIAWFTNEIPINFGPYVFNGLPGLIVDIYDSNGNFRFEFTEINQKKLPIYKESKEEILKVTNKKFKEIEAKYHERPDLFIIGVDSSTRKKIPYNPIELTD